MGSPGSGRSGHCAGDVTPLRGATGFRGVSERLGVWGAIQAPSAARDIEDRRGWAGTVPSEWGYGGHFAVAEVTTHS